MAGRQSALGCPAGRELLAGPFGTHLSHITLPCFLAEAIARNKTIFHKQTGQNKAPGRAGQGLAVYAWRLIAGYSKRTPSLAILAAMA